jgi:hypothetical protein
MARREGRLRFILPIFKVAVVTVMIYRIFQTELEKNLFALVERGTIQIWRRDKLAEISGVFNMRNELL